MPDNNWSVEEVKDTLVRLGVCRKSKDLFINDKCSLGLGTNGKMYIYVHEGRVAPIENEFARVSNVTVVRSGKIKAY